MRKILRSMMIVPCLLASAACAHDGMLAPELAPEPESAALGVAPAQDPAALGPLTCAATTVVPRVVREPVYIVDGMVLEGPPEDIEAMDIVAIEVIKVTGPGEPGTVRITTRAGGGR
jgi:hypothetical protein